MPDRIYDGERHVIRAMTRAYDDMRRLDREAVAAEWNHSNTFSPIGFHLAARFTDMLASV